MRTRVLPLAAATLLSIAACPQSNRRPAVPGARAKIIEAPSELLWGPSAFGAIGDIRIDNGRILAVITSIDRPAGFAVSGGNLIDIAALPGGEDQLNQITLYLNDEFPRQARYDSVEIVKAGGGKKPAIVRAKGLDTKDARIHVETDYILHPDREWITLETRFTSTASVVIRGYRPGDAIQWGRCQHIAPKAGFELPGRRLRVDWVAGLGDGTSYGYVPDGRADLEVLSGSMWSDPIAEPLDLHPKKAATYVRHVVVGRGDTASLQPAISTIRKQAFGRITGSATHESEPITDARIRVLDADGALMGIAQVGSDGWYQIDVPPGRYQLEARAPGREPAGPTAEGTVFDVAAGGTVSRSFRLGPRASVEWRVTGDTRFAPPVKVTIVGIDGTASPYLGPSFAARGARNIVLSSRGVGKAPVGMGRFRVLISRGPEYELIEQTVEVREGAHQHIEGQLRRVVDTSGFIAADLHQHASPSFDSGVSLADRALSNAAEGVEVLVSTDHNVVIDYRPTIASVGLGRSVFSIVGTEATTHSVGHFNAFPIRIERGDARGGMADPEGWAPQKIFDFVRGLGDGKLSPFIQVNHPRAGEIGYFDLMKLDPKTGAASDPRFTLDFDGMEVISFGWAGETKQTLDDWFALLRRGHRITATGNSDSHTIFGREVGWARTYVCVDDDTPYRLNVAAFVKALRKGCATVGAGPFVTIESGDTKMGGTKSAPDGSFEVRVRVQAPSWVPTDELVLYVDGVIHETIPLSADGVVRFDGTRRLRCKRDCFVVAVARSDAELPEVVTSWRRRKPRPIALTNPIYVDVDGDGRYLSTSP